MKWPSDNIEQALKRESALGPMRDSADFWSDFNARARMRRQEAPEHAKLPVFYGWSLATACATLLLVMAGVFMFRARPDTGGSAITSFDIGVNYRAAIITPGGNGQAAMLWVMDMDTGSPEKDVL